MRSATRHLFAGFVVAAALGPGAMQGPSFALVAGPAQVELDRIVSRVAGRIITLSDVRQARELRLVEDTSSDAATTRALENRWLILAEIGRAAPLPPASDAEMAARRAEWQAAAGDRAAAMPDADLQAWLRDDLRIRAYLNRQFGMLPEGERGRARGEWIGRLRQRAELD
jgi:hypothetical protein